MNKPIKLLPARAWRTYTGGKLIEHLHGNINGTDSQYPEEWIMSIVEARNANQPCQQPEGLSLLEDGGSLKELLIKEPNLLGRATELGVLVKFIDSAERLAIQVHPDKVIAETLFRSKFGKTECWYILGGRLIDNEPPCIYLGFRPGITKAYWKELFLKQDIPAMLDCLHRFEAKPGETYLVEGGVPHAIGGGCFLIEIQEPTDFTLRTERITPNGLKISDQACHQGAGFEAMFDCFHYDGLTEEEAVQRWKIPPIQLNAHEVELVGYKNTECFRMTELQIDGELDLPPQDIYCGIAALSGNGTINSSKISAGDQFFIPAKTPCRLCGKLRLIRCYGPLID